MSLTAMDWPSWLYPAHVEIGLLKQATQHRSELAGSLQSVVSGVELWVLTLSFRDENTANSGALEALINMLTGGEQPIRAWHFARPQPIGTMRGSPTVRTAVSQFARTMSLQTTAGATLKAGDMFKVNSQLMQSAANTTADGSGVMNVTTVNRVRRSIAAGAAVTWDKVTADFIMPETSSKAVHSQGLMKGRTIALEELP